MKTNVILTMLLILVFLVSCHNGISKSDLAHINANLGNLAIVAEPSTCFFSYKPEVSNPLSGFGKGASEGAAKGAGGGLMISGEGSGDNECFLFLLPFFIIGGAIIGGVIEGTMGAFQAVPEEVSSGIERFADNFFDNKNINEFIAHDIYLNSLRTRGDLDPRVYKKTIPSDGKDANDSAELFYQRLKQENKITMLCVEVTNLSFEGGKGRSPSLALHIEVNTKLVSVADNRVIFQKNYEYTSLEYPWRSWKKENGSLLEMELDVACRELGKQICNEQLKMPAEITDE